MNRYETILSHFSVSNPTLAANAVLGVPADFSAIEAALIPHITDVTLRAQAAARVLQERLLPVVVPPLPPTPPTPPRLTWKVVVAWIAGVLLSCILIATFVMSWVGLKTQATTDEVANMLARSQTAITTAISNKGDDVMTEVDNKSNAVITAVNTKGDQVITAVNAKGDQVITAVNAKGDELKRDLTKVIVDNATTTNNLVKDEAAKIRWASRRSEISADQNFASIADKLQKLQTPRIRVKVIK